MSQNIIPSPLDCSGNCVPTGTSSPPGPVGPEGPPGTDGTNGINAETTHADGDGLMPNGNGSGDTVTLNTTSSTAFMSVGEPIWVEGWGTLIVEAIPTDTSVTLSNPADSTSGTYAGNASAGTTLAALARIVPTGFQGVTGTLDGSLYLLKANNLSDVPVAATARTNLGLGTAAVRDATLNTGGVPINEGVLLSGQSVWVGASGLVTKTSANARTALGLGTAATYTVGILNTNLPPVDQVGGLGNLQVLFATTTGIKSVDAGTARTLLGIGSGTTYSLYQYILSNNFDGPAGTGSVQTVPLNTENTPPNAYTSLLGTDVVAVAGTYRFRFGIVTYDVGIAVGWLYNLTTTAVIANGYGVPIVQAAGALTSIIVGQGRIILSGTTTLRLQAVLSGGGSPLLGKAAGIGYPEQYSWLELERES